MKIASFHIMLALLAFSASGARAAVVSTADRWQVGPMGVGNDPSLKAQEGSAASLRYYYPLPAINPPRVIEADVCVYGGTPGGVMAAIQAARMGKKSVLVEFGRNIGGLTSGGLSATDGGKSAGGISQEFYKVVGKAGFQPAAAEAQFRKMLTEAQVTTYLEHRLIQAQTEAGRIVEIKTENGNRFRAKIFIDATYEGDLLAVAGVSYHVGREANSVYNETHNGVCIFRKPGGNQFSKPVNPYMVPGDAKSGLLPRISQEALGSKGDGDARIQAYNFRMFFEKDGLPFPKPVGYDPGQYALLVRYMAAGGPCGIPIHPGDVNNSDGFSTDNIGANYSWPDGPGRDVTKPVPVQRHVNLDQITYLTQLYQLREKIYQDHITYQQGLCYFLANDPQVPEDVRAKMNVFGLTRKSFVETGGWSHQLYIREGRRMVADYVMTMANCEGREVAGDSIGLAEYTMDSHNARRLVVNGTVQNEGDVQKGTPRPYPVSYRAIVPKSGECTNLLVPVALSSSHIAYGSIRMEPVFMVLGQSAGTAAALAIDHNQAVQKVDYEALLARLLADHQYLDYAQLKQPVTKPPAP